METWLALTLLTLGIALLVGLTSRLAREAAPAGRGNDLVRLTAGPVRKVLDGDTLIVQAGWDRVTLRLDGIDCPEFDQPWGDIAKHGLIKLVGGRTVHYETHGVDRYKRTLATLYVWDREESVWLNVNLRMVMLGHAWVSPAMLEHLPAARRKEMLAVSRWARRKRVGLWNNPAPVPPWQWRNGDRAQ
jgi:endonuclease YncB( thermonuclease family)